MLWLILEVEYEELVVFIGVFVLLESGWYRKSQEDEHVGKMDVRCGGVEFWGVFIKWGIYFTFLIEG